MSRPKPAHPVKLIVGLLAAERNLLDEVLRTLTETYGPADWIGAVTVFNYTEYYARELGSNLLRRFATFERLISPESLPDIKLMANTMEDRFSKDGKRRVNIDPGYIAEAHLILATGKGYTHRPYLRDGIYADLTLVYTDKTFHAMEWTYPDYASEAMLEDLKRIREKYLIQIKDLKTVA
ncbi:MAG: DUF4416 family protein [Syntrophales bacterium LBB04]|nr:DUF4416 family protein [Syntrophales bacterium LBB04]